MQGNLNRRLNALEQMLEPEPLIVLAVNPENGNAERMTSEEMIERGYRFGGCISGGSECGEDIQAVIDWIAYSNGVLNPCGGFLTERFRRKAQEEQTKHNS